MKKLILAVSILGFASAPAFAQMVEFTAADANSDGSVTLEEATAAGLTWTDEQFTAADKDGSGGLSEEEYKNANAG
jgi:opacity protein-like surface antigen